MLTELGKYSYVLYLTHIPLAGLFSNLFSRNEYTLYFILFYSLLVVAMTLLFVFLIRKMCGKLSWLSIVTGVKS